MSTFYNYIIGQNHNIRIIHISLSSIKNLRITLTNQNDEIKCTLMLGNPSYYFI
jgi:hypothetical protein